MCAALRFTLASAPPSVWLAVSQIINKEGVKEANRENDGWVIKDGIIVIIKDSVIPSGKTWDGGQLCTAFGATFCSKMHVHPAERDVLIS